MIHVEVEQSTEAWFEAKLGKPSASNASKIITQEGKPSKQREGYLYELAAERIRQKRHVGYINADMVEGMEREAESRKLYELMHDCEVKPGGICYPDEKKQILCSPDGLVWTGPTSYDRHGLEMKNVIPKIQVEYLLANRVPSEYFGQIQFSLLVTGFKRWDFISYCPGLPPLIIHVERDEKYLSMMRDALVLFCGELDEIVKKIG